VGIIIIKKYAILEQEIDKKASTYAFHGAKRSLSTILFVNLDVAMNWLDLNKTEQAWVLSKLRAENE